MVNAKSTVFLAQNCPCLEGITIIFLKWINSLLTRMAQFAPLKPKPDAIQPKPEVGQPNDEYDQQADAVADRVSLGYNNSNFPPVQMAPLPSNSLFGTNVPEIQRAPVEEDEEYVSFHIQHCAAANFQLTNPLPQPEQYGQPNKAFDEEEDKGAPTEAFEPGFDIVGRSFSQ